MNTIYINIFGGPGAGKSTNAYQLAADAKKSGYSVELVTEVAKDFVWEDRMTTLMIQPYVTVKQYRNLFRLKGKVDYVITDAPVMLGWIYADKYASHLPPSYKEFVCDLNRIELQPAINILLNRAHAYDSNGRYQSEEEAKLLDEDILKMLNETKQDYVQWTSGDFSFEDVKGILHGNSES